MLTLVASIIAAVESNLSTFDKVLLAAVGAGVGTLVVLGPIVYVASLLAAPHRQRNHARAEGARLSGLLADVEREATEAHVSLSIDGAIIGERDHDAVVQLNVRVTNEGAPTTVYGWGLSIDLGPTAWETHNVKGEPPLEMSKELPLLDRIGNQPLGTGEMMGLVQFSVRGVGYQQFLDTAQAADGPIWLLLTARCGSTARIEAKRDLALLMADETKTVDFGRPRLPAPSAQANAIYTATVRKHLSEQREKTRLGNPG